MAGISFFCYPANYPDGVDGTETMDYYDGILILTSSYPTTGTVTNEDGNFFTSFTIPADDCRTI
ncbi:MAG: hypothetical protein ACLFSQ_12610 [Candidatus Zixiibacteriota bacterium]